MKRREFLALVAAVPALAAIAPDDIFAAVEDDDALSVFVRLRNSSTDEVVFVRELEASAEEWAGSFVSYSIPDTTVAIEVSGSYVLEAAIRRPGASDALAWTRIDADYKYAEPGDSLSFDWSIVIDADAG